jgi:group II intron reverse transcriptase/maturase
MRSAETVLGVIQDRGRRGLPLEDIYRQLYNPNLYLRAYAHLARNQGALTPGSTSETIDGMSGKTIARIIDALRHERYHWSPVRRTYVPKKNGKVRPLGISSWSDKLLQEVIRPILEAYYEPQFSSHSHGFRPNRGCHTALSEVARTWTGTCWFVEADISRCFERIDRTVLLAILGEKVHDNRFLRLIETMLRAGYLEEWRYHATLSGTPRGAGCSPVLSNVYMDRLDRFVEQVLIPAYTRGTTRRWNPPYKSLMNAVDRARKRGRFGEATVLGKQAQHLPSHDPQDPRYRRLHYVRYADDCLLGFAGPKAEAEEIKRQLGAFLHDTLKLDLSEDKTLITHARTSAARFLGYELVVQQANDKQDRHGHRAINGCMGLRVPAEVIDQKCALYLRNGKPIDRPRLIHDDDFSIIQQYQMEYRGVVQYYLLAQNVCWFWKLHWIMQTALLKTLAHRHKARVRAIARKYRSVTQTPYGPMKSLEVSVERPGKPPLVARFGGIPLRRQRTVILVDHNPPSPKSDRNELLKRLLADTCELCGATQECEVHHLRKLADLKQRGRREKPVWIQIMAARQRKTLVVCRRCHDAIHAGRPPGQRTGNRSLESRVLRKA